MCFVLGKVNIPPPAALPDDGIVFPYTLVGDEAFALNPYMMRLRRARQVIENCLGECKAMYLNYTHRG